MKNQHVIILFMVISAFTIGCKKKSDPGASPTPTPITSPTPAPTPSERYPGLPSACQSLTNGTGGGSCSDAEANSDSSFKFLTQMQSALSELVQQRPDIYEADGETIRQGKWDDYIKGVMANMSAKGVCAVYDGYEMMVRDSRNLSERFHMDFRGRARAFTLEKCAPARPMPAFFTSPPPHDAWCPLPNSNGGGGCGGSNTWLNTVDSMLRDLIAQELVKGAASTILDTTKIRQGDELGYYIKNTELYHRRLVEMAHQRNLCAYTDYFDSLFLKSPTGANAFSDVYDVVYHSPSGDITMRSPGFSGRCSPSEF